MLSIEELNQLSYETSHPTEATEAERLIQTLTKGTAQDLTTSEGYLKPWLPQPGETAQEFIAFNTWLQAGPARPRVISKIAQERFWEQRALAYDAWLEVQPPDVQAQAADIAQSLMTSIALVSQMLRIELVKILTQVSTCSAASVSLTDAAKVLETMARTSRLLAGLTTETVGLGRLDLSHHTQEELLELDRLTTKALTR
jgi:hypothetical protein